MDAMEEHRSFNTAAPPLQAARQALANQLACSNARSQHELRDTGRQLLEAGRRRAAAAAALHGHRASLERLQAQLEAASSEQAEVSLSLGQIGSELSTLIAAAAGDAELQRTKQERVLTLQRQLDAATAALRHARACGNDETASLALSTRAACAADDRTRRQAQSGEERDALKERLQHQLATLTEKASTYDDDWERHHCSVLEATQQAADVAAAVGEVQEGMAALTRQSKAALVTLRARDAALTQALEASRQQQDARHALVASRSRYLTDLEAARHRNEAAGAAARQRQAQAERLAAQAAAAQEMRVREESAEQAAQKAVESERIELEDIVAAGKAAQRDRAQLDGQQATLDQEIKRLGEEQLGQLGDKIGASASAKRVARDIRAAAAAAETKASATVAAGHSVEAAAVEGEEVDAANTLLAGEVQSAEAALATQLAEVDSAERALHHLQRDIERATRDVQVANREVARREMGSLQREDTAPREVTVASLQRDVTAKMMLSQQLREQWEALQDGLVSQHARCADAARTVLAAEAQAEALQNMQRLHNKQ